MRSRPMRVLAIAAALTFVAAACGGNATPSPTTSTSTGPGPTAVATEQPTSAPTFALPSFSPAALRWYCCLGTGEDPSQVPTEKDVAAKIAQVFPGSSLKFEAITYQSARATLSTQIAGGNAPDIVGPVGIGGLAAFQGQWLDLASYISASHYDLSQFDPAAVDFYKSTEGEIGIPFDVYPSMVWYKKGLFAEAGLNEPPHKYGDKYTMPDGSVVDWNYDTVAQIAKLLTVDKNGRDATDPAFDKAHIVQYGFEPQRDDLRGLGAYWGAGNLTGPDGKTVVIPDAWKAAWKYFYDGMWGPQPFIMTGPVFQSDAFGGGEYSFFSGKVAMSENFLWTTYGVANAGTDWDLAAIPSYNGTVTAPLNADTFGILKASKNPAAAFAALTYILGDASDQLLQLYGGMPARPAKQDAFFQQLGQSDGFPAQVDWQVAKDSVAYADNPNFEAPMPKYNETLNILNKYLSKWTTTGGLNMDNEFQALTNEIQAQWNS
jgi:multiple sugar transport system substrate-binding protein